MTFPFFRDGDDDDDVALLHPLGVMNCHGWDGTAGEASHCRKDGSNNRPAAAAA